MQVISRPRRGGKTTDAVQWVKADPDRVLICPDEQQARYVRRHFDLTDKQCMSVHSSHNKLRGRRVVLGLDNVDMFRWQDLLLLGAASVFQPIELATETRLHP